MGKRGSEITLVLLVIVLSPRAVWRPGAVLTWLLRAASISEWSYQVLYFLATEGCIPVLGMHQGSLC